MRANATNGLARFAAATVFGRVRKVDLAMDHANVAAVAELPGLSVEMAAARLGGRGALLGLGATRLNARAAFSAGDAVRGRPGLPCGGRGAGDTGAADAGGGRAGLLRGRDGREGRPGRDASGGGSSGRGPGAATRAGPGAAAARGRRAPIGSSHDHQAARRDQDEQDRTAERRPSDPSVRPQAQQGAEHQDRKRGQAEGWLLRPAANRHREAVARREGCVPGTLGDVTDARALASFVSARRAGECGSVSKGDDADYALVQEPTARNGWHSKGRFRRGGSCPAAVVAELVSVFACRRGWSNRKIASAGMAARFEREIGTMDRSTCPNRIVIGSPPTRAVWLS